MREDFLNYYERELTVLRQLGAEFAEKYPKIASRLLLEQNRCGDPHVERMIEAFALLAARVHLKIDDEFPEITQALLGIVYPHFLRPVPSMTVVQFQLDPTQGKQTAGVTIPRGSLLHSRPVDGVPLKFTTCYDTVLWPIEVVAAQLLPPDRLDPPVGATDAVAALRLELQCLPDVAWNALDLDSLQFHINAESDVAQTLYELLCNNCRGILVRNRVAGRRARSVRLESQSLRPLGFTEDEAILPYPGRSFRGYRLLQEYFAFPEKFLFFELRDLRRIWTEQFEATAEIIFLLSRFERPDRQQLVESGLSKKTFRLGCSPVVNLFQQTAEPILLHHRRSSYPLVPDVRRRSAMEVFSVDEVVSVQPDTREALRFEPFFCYRHGARANGYQAYWYINRRASDRVDDSGTEVDLTLVSSSGAPMRPNVETVTVRLTCTNRDLPSRVRFGTEEGDFDLEGVPMVNRIVSLRQPTETHRPPLRKEAFWPLISQLSLNYLSLAEENKEALKAILKLYNFSGSPDLDRQVEGISRINGRRHFARVISEGGVSFARGTRVEIEFDESQFVGGGVYLFASVLERFLALYATLNSFAQTVARTQQRKEVLREWAPRAGEKPLI